MCRPALEVHPRPGVYQSCVMGRVAAFEHSCMPACMAQQVGKTYDSHAVCKSESKKQNPDAHVSWCRKAYDQTAPEVKRKVTAKIAKEFPSSATDQQDDEVTTSDVIEEVDVTISEYTIEATESDRTNSGGDDFLLQSHPQKGIPEVLFLETKLLPHTSEETPDLSVESGVSLVRQEPNVKETEAILQPNDDPPDFFHVENNTAFADKMDDESFEKDATSHEQFPRGEDSWMFNVDDENNIAPNFSVPDLTNINLTKDELLDLRKEGVVEL